MQRRPLNQKLDAALMGFDLEGWARDHGARSNPNNAAEMTMQCPMCSKADKLCINVDYRVWHCWFCVSDKGGGQRARGGAIDLIAMIDRITKREAYDFIVKNAQSVPIGDLDVLQKLVMKMENIAPPKFAWALPIDWPSHCRRIEMDDNDAWPFLRRRGITMHDVIECDLRICYDGNYRDRVVFPVFERGHLVYWQARATWTKEDQQGGLYLKSLNPPRHAIGSGKNDVVMNLDSARKHDRIVVTEGPIDMIHAGATAVCTFGKNITNLQIQKMHRLGVRQIDLMWDGDAHKAMEAAAPKLASVFDEVRLVYLPPGGPDPGEMSRAEIMAYRSAARHWKAA